MAGVAGAWALNESKGPRRHTNLFGQVEADAFFVVAQVHAWLHVVEHEHVEVAVPIEVGRHEPARVELAHRTGSPTHPGESAAVVAEQLVALVPAQGALAEDEGLVVV